MGSIVQLLLHWYNGITEKRGEIIMKWLFNFSILALIWSVYYLAKRATSGLLDLADVIVCGAIIIFCIVNIVTYIIRKVKEKR